MKEDIDQLLTTFNEPLFLAAMSGKEPLLRRLRPLRDDESSRDNGGGINPKLSRETPSGVSIL